MPQLQLQNYAEGVALDGLPVNVANGGPNPVYYGNDGTVSASNNLGQIASGASMDFNVPTYLFGPGSTVQVSSIPDKPLNNTGVVGDIPVVTGAKGGNAALTSLIAALVQIGLVQDTTT